MAVRKFVLADLSPEDFGFLLCWHDAFIASNVSGHMRSIDDWDKGLLSNKMFAQYVQSQYAVYSYDTAIAWQSQGLWYVNTDDYSSTTSHHQRLVKAALAAVDLDYTLL